MHKMCVAMLAYLHDKHVCRMWHTLLNLYLLPVYIHLYIDARDRGRVPVQVVSAYRVHAWHECKASNKQVRLLNGFHVYVAATAVVMMLVAVRPIALL
jgi:hypothetical protein